MNLKELLAKKEEILSQMKALTELSEWSAEQEASFTSLKEELEKTKSRIDLVQGFEEESKQPTALQAAGHVLAGKKEDNGIPGPRGKTEFESLDEFMSAAMSGKSDPRLDDCYVDYRSEQSMGAGSKGGFAVPKQFLPEIKQIAPTEALVRPRATVIPAGSPPDAEVTLPALDQEPLGDGTPNTYSGVTIEKLEEGGLKPETDFNLRLISLKPYEMAARIPMTDKLLRNWQAASGWASQLLRTSLTAFEDHQFLTGNGVGGPEGVLDTASTLAVNRATSTQIAFVDLKNMYSRFFGNEANAVWVVSYSAFRQLLDMVGDGGGATNIVQYDKSTGSLSVYGIPVRKHPRMRTLGAKGDLLLSDFKDYLIKDGSGPIIELGYATGQWERNKRSVKITFNVDGRSWLTKPYKNEEDYEVSSSVVLDLPSGS
jgi:HK97 family phage major capsid protein